MTGFLQALGFGTPLALLGLIALPIIWWLLRFTPPRPRQLAFPPIRILLGLPNQQETPDKTPWWLLLLRLALAALFILAVAQPFLQPKGGSILPVGHRLIIVDDGWAAAANWEKHQAHLQEVLEQARLEGSAVTLTGTTPTTLPLNNIAEPARDALETARLMKPVAQFTNRSALLEKLRDPGVKDVTSVVWLSDGLDTNGGQKFVDGLRELFPAAQLRVTIPDTKNLPLALSKLAVQGSDITTTVLKSASQTNGPTNVIVQAINGRTLLELPVDFAGANEKQIVINLPTTLRNEIQSIGISGQAHAGARQLFDDRWRKRTIALQGNEAREQAQPLLSPLHYLRRGLEPFAELYEPQTDAELSGLMDAGLSMLVLADIGQIPEQTKTRLEQWINGGGILLRFAGPRLAAATDDLLPVKLREGDRTLGSALSWEVPQGLAAFPEASPFAGLVIDPKITVTRQVLAEPDPEISDRTWASLTDGTPLVTAQKRGKGLIVLFHVTSNASWSNLPLSGLFLSMLQKVAGLDATATSANTTASSDAFYIPRMLLAGNGELVSADGNAPPIAAIDIESSNPRLFQAPGLYVRQGRERAINLGIGAADLKALPASLNGASVQAYEAQPRSNLAPLVFAAAAVLFLLDCLATLLLGGGLRRARPALAVLALLALVPLLPPPAHAEDAPVADADMQAALNSRLAYVKTGDAEIDETSRTGLRGLTIYVTDRTSASLAEANGIDIEKDEIVFYPLLYWPVRETEVPLSDIARSKVANYLKNGGTIFFDTRDGGLSTSEGGGAIRSLLQNLDLPPLEPTPDKHVLTRSFYLLDNFPGRFEGPRPWVEAESDSESASPGTADGVSTVIIGSNDYAAAWAIDDTGQPLYAVVPGSDRQREFAIRTGINVVMYALTGNYKADQVHVPALLERLGQ